MLDAAFLFGVLCASLAASYGDRAAWALLMSAAIGVSFSAFGMPFVLEAWIMLDLAVVLVIIWAGIRWRDMAILALFLPLWGTYLFDTYEAYSASVIITAAQMALSLPASRLWMRLRAFRHRSTGEEFDMRVAHHV